jgi:hypothetical protein
MAQTKSRRLHPLFRNRSHVSHGPVGGGAILSATPGEKNQIMKRKQLTKLALSLAAGALLSGCATTGMFSSNTGGAMVALQSEGESATEAPYGNKTGEACSSNILGIISMGDSSIAAAKEAGGVSTVSAVDHKYLNILALYGKHCTIVSGS